MQILSISTKSLPIVISCYGKNIFTILFSPSLDGH
ncbi:Uncharacterised protein [Enterobacter hormaechei]|nr:Uncharacterised protein [Enterobacter hormaechei]SAI43521.1 Uncharacterised protein [Enterobacter hormaechei]